MGYLTNLKLLITDAQNEIDKAIKLQDKEKIKTAQAYKNGLDKAAELYKTIINR